MLHGALNLYRFGIAGGGIVWKQDITRSIYDETRFNDDVMILFIYIPPKTCNVGKCMKAR